MASSTQPTHFASEHWLHARYWHFSACIALLASPLLALWGSLSDAIAITLYVALTLGCWLIAQRSATSTGVNAHLLALIPYWAWYSGLEGGIPLQYGPGVGEYVVLLLMPILMLVTLGSQRNAVLAVGLTIAGLFWRWPEWEHRLVGMFLIGTSVLIGLVFRQLALQFQQAQHALEKLAFCDPLTGLLNRRALEERAQAAFEKETHGALLFVDLDRFKTVNDVFGHEAGDTVLRQIAQRMLSVLPDNALLARVGGDEFAVLLDAPLDETAEHLGEALIKAVTVPILFGARTLHIGCSVGVARFPLHGHSLDTILTAADTAMYEAKGAGGGVFTAELDERQARQQLRSIEVELRGLAERDELFLMYQPILDLETERFIGAEALVRWNHPERGTISPAQFIPLAEETLEIIDIDCWVLRTAAYQLELWKRLGFSGWLSVNVSAATLGHPRWEEALRKVEQRGVLSQLVLELTESVAVGSGADDQLEALRKRGCRIAIDDFGMGYSSLGYLKNLNAEHLKLDRAFIDGIHRHARDEQLIEMVLRLARAWDMNVVAEGVETLEQRRWLESRGCQLAQGYGLARPMSPEQAEELLIQKTSHLKLLSSLAAS